MNFLAIILTASICINAFAVWQLMEFSKRNSKLSKRNRELSALILTLTVTGLIFWKKDNAA